MSTKTNIEWTDMSWNPTTGCTRVSEGCRHCYIERTPAFRMAGRKFANGTTGVLLHPDRLDAPLHWKKPRRVFVNSLSDLFHEEVPFDFIDKVFGVMGSEEVGHHEFQVLTKRPQRLLAYTQRFSRNGIEFDKLFPQVWLGVSVEDQATLWRLDELRRVPAAIRFVSFEPLLEDLGIVNLNGIQWAILGGESGPLARPCNLAWIRSLKDQCQWAGVPPFIKQVGAHIITNYYDDWREEGYEAEGLEWPDPIDWNIDIDGQPPLDVKVRLKLKDKKGGDMAEWPEDIRLREYPR